MDIGKEVITDIRASNVPMGFAAQNKDGTETELHRAGPRQLAELVSAEAQLLIKAIHRCW